MPTLTVTNNRDGTITARLADPFPGAVYSLWRQPYTGLIGAGLPAAEVSEFFPPEPPETLDHVTDLATPNGYYLWFADSVADGAGASNVVLQACTDGTESLHERIQQAALARAVTLDLPGIVTVKRQKKPSVELNVDELPAVLHVTFQTSEQEDAELGSNLRDGWAFPIFVVVVREGLNNDETDAADTLIRERYRRAFHNQGLDGVNEVELCRVEPGPIVDMVTQDLDVQLGSWVLRFRCKEERGLVL